MRKARNFAFVLTIISIVMIISGTVSSFVVSLKEDRVKTQARMVVVNDTFDDFNESVSLFEVERDKIYTETLGNVYYDSLLANDVAVKEKFSNYEKIVDSIETKVKNMDKLCDDVYYPDSSVNSKCSNYKMIYEQVVNYFVGDVEVYNGTIKTFNEQQTAAGTGLVLEEYKSVKKYIDYNKDKSYDGKEVD